MSGHLAAAGLGVLQPHWGAGSMSPSEGGISL